jgi:hypothetical protein
MSARRPEQSAQNELLLDQANQVFAFLKTVSPRPPQFLLLLGAIDAFALWLHGDGADDITNYVRGHFDALEHWIAAAQSDVDPATIAIRALVGAYFAPIVRMRRAAA